MSEQFWLHFYGLVTVAALAIAIAPIILPRVGSWSLARKIKKKKDLEDELQAFKLYLSDDKYMQRRFRAMLSDGLLWLSAGLAIGVWGIGFQADNPPLFKHVVFTVAGMCLGSSVGSFWVLRFITKRFLSPDKTISNIQARIEKLH